MPFEDMEDVALTLEEAEEFLGNYWPGHDVGGEQGMVLLQESYEKVRDAANAVWKLESLLEHKALDRILAPYGQKDGEEVRDAEN